MWVMSSGKIQKCRGVEHYEFIMRIGLGEHWKWHIGPW